MSKITGILLSLAACGAAACDGAGRQTPISPQSGPSPAALTLGGRKLDVVLVLLEKDRRHAVPRLAAPNETQGYLLAWPRERFMKIESEQSRAAFDVLFLDKSGAIVDLQPLKTYDEEGIMPKSPAAYALLVMPGLPQKLGVKAGDKAALSPEILSAKPEELTTMTINGVPAFVEFALTEAERNHGLMFRPRMSPDDGMLFAYADEYERGFWMKNTLIPLDIAFFSADGTLLNVNETPTAADPRAGPWPTSPSKGQARYVLEMHLGWFKKKGITDGSGNFAPGTKALIPPQAMKGTWD
ncbi:MAG: DUF192 domain-containing protein [Planctomycetes bacterium]|nr:DUF192 domain-containing protein [Planctomycetota bacterium]